MSRGGGKQLSPVRELVDLAKGGRQSEVLTHVEILKKLE